MECTENIEGGLELIRVEEDYEEEDESVLKFMILWWRHKLHLILQKIGGCPGIGRRSCTVVPYSRRPRVPAQANTSCKTIG